MALLLNNSNKPNIKMNKKFIITTILIAGIFFDSSAQEKKWTLEECISYAVENNIGLKRQELETQTAEMNYLKSRMNVLPSLNFGSDARMGFGRSIDPVTNSITFKQNISNSYSLNSNLQVFSGFSLLNTISSNKFMLNAGIESEKIVRNNLIIDILGQYYQVMYATGLENAARLQLELSEAQEFRIKRMVEAGKEALSRQYEMESQVSSDRLAYTIAHNTTSQAVTTMKQMLQLDPGTQFDLMIPELDKLIIDDKKFNTDSIFSVASEILPRLKAIEYELKAATRQIAAARGAISPSLSVGGSVYTGYYKVISEDEIEQTSFSDQLRNNNSQAVYLSLDIPLFNNYTNARNIKNAKLRKNDAILRLELEKNNLYTEIENACLDYSRGRDEFLAAVSNLEFNRKSFSAVEKKFETGLVDVTDYSAAKTKLYRAETEELRTKLQLLIRQLTITFYTTGEYKNVIFN